jgi:hypothetical protein
VEAEERGRERVYYLVPRGLDEIRRYMDRTSRIWDDALDAFKRNAEEGSDDHP